MFGHDDNQQTNDHDQGFTGPVAPAPGTDHDDAGLGDESTVHPSAPVVDNSGNGFIMDPVPPSAGAAAASHAQAAGSPVHDDLLSIKQQALQQLSPLVGHLDQTPEEKFRTLMMMIQASDDQSKLQEAYDIAKQITDEKVRAQALLDVVNEINYFTQQHKS